MGTLWMAHTSHVATVMGLASELRSYLSAFWVHWWLTLWQQHSLQSESFNGFCKLGLHIPFPFYKASGVQMKSKLWIYPLLVYWETNQNCMTFWWRSVVYKVGWEEFYIPLGRSSQHAKQVLSNMSPFSANFSSLWSRRSLCFKGKTQY